MSMRMTSVYAVAAAIALACCGGVSARTVAYWPMEYDSLNGEWNGRNMVGGNADTLTLNQGISVSGETPVNVVSSGLAFDPYSYSYVSNSATAAGPAMMNRALSADVVSGLMPTHDLTIEGWVRFASIPENGTWWVVLNALHGSGSSDCGWMLSLRRTRGSGENKSLSWELWGRGIGDNVLAYVDDKESITDRWMHVALTLDYDGGSNGEKSLWSLYVDGTCVGTLTDDKIAAETVAFPYIDFGGRKAGSSSASSASFDSWRLSDECLTPERFLNYGTTERTVSATVAYWKLGRTASGGVDGAPSVGNAWLSGGAFGETTDLSESTIAANEDCAFSENPPNQSAALPDGNAGSFLCASKGAYVQTQNLGAELTLADSFTVEGWFKPRRSSRDAYTSQYLCCTRYTGNVNGWALILKRQNSKWRLGIYAHDNSENTLLYDVLLDEDLSDWSDWRHVALTYDPAAADGKGVWTIYLDGTSLGTIENQWVPVAGGESSHFNIGGRKNSGNGALGSFDCWRVTRGVLSADKLLCSDGGSPATGNVLAYWPLNTDNGAYLDGTDVSGNGYHLVLPRDSSQMAVGNADKPIVSNPDASLSFRGGRDAGNGSADFSAADKAYLFSADDDACSAFSGENGFTVEGYFRRTAEWSAWELLFGFTYQPTVDAHKAIMNLSFRENGFALFANDLCGLNDEPFAGSLPSDLPIGEWKHVALTLQTEMPDAATTNAIWKLYLDGTLKATLTGKMLRNLPTPYALFVGGRPHSENSFAGRISNMRISAKTLVPGEFLCDEGETSAAPASGTVAYWAFDNDNGVADVGSKVTPGYALEQLGGTLSGSADQAVTRVPEPDATPSFDGDAAANAGSVVFTDGCGYGAPNLGLLCDVNRSFTVEGWLKSDPSATAGRRIIAGTYRADKNVGWKLMLDTEGATPRLRLLAKGHGPLSALADGCFDWDASALTQGWKHIALVYDHTAGNGTWRLFVSGFEKASMENEWAPGADTLLMSHPFTFGAAEDAGASFSGALDLWRVSLGVVPREDFLRGAGRFSFVIR